MINHKARMDMNIEQQYEKRYPHSTDEPRIHVRRVRKPIIAMFGGSAKSSDKTDIIVLLRQ